jgi:hypothetical protein
MMTRVEQEIQDLLNEAAAALGSGDWPRYAAVWAHTPTIQLLHPTQGEWLTG